MKSVSAYPILLVVLACSQVLAQQIAPVESKMLPAPLPLVVMPPTMKARPFNRIMYVLDVSGSMSSHLADAIRVTGTFGSDDSRVAVITFNDTHERWKGVKVPCHHLPAEEHNNSCLEPGWAFMPLHNRELMSHLARFGGKGSTNPTSALEYAFKNAPEGTLIVFISDGVFSVDDYFAVPGVLSTLRNVQAWRRVRKLAPVEMLVWATSEQTSKNKSLAELARQGGGGLWRADTRRSGPW